MQRAIFLWVSMPCLCLTRLRKQRDMLRKFYRRLNTLETCSTYIVEKGIFFNQLTSRALKQGISKWWLRTSLQLYTFDDVELATRIWQKFCCVSELMDILSFPSELVALGCRFLVFQGLSNYLARKIKLCDLALLLKCFQFLAPNPFIVLWFGLVFSLFLTPHNPSTSF